MRTLTIGLLAAGSWFLSAQPGPPQRRGPVGPMPDAALVEAIQAVLAASPFHGEGHRKVWARRVLPRLSGRRRSAMAAARSQRKSPEKPMCSQVSGEV